MLSELASFYCWLIRFIIPVAAVTVIFLCAKILLVNKKGKPVLAEFFDKSGTVYPITSYENAIGRGKQCDICVPSKRAALRAAALTLKNDGWHIFPVTSAAVLVNGERIDGDSLIEHGDTVNIGGAELELDDRIESDIPFDVTGELNRTRAVCAAAVLTAMQVMMALSLILHYAFIGDIPVQIPACFGGLILVEWVYLVLMKFKKVGVELLAFFLCTFGLAVAASAVPAALYKQFIAMIAGLIVFRVLCLVLTNLELTMKLRYAVGICAIGLLMFNIIFGTEMYGAKNWIDLGPITVQPSEFVKIAYIFAGCATLERLMTTRNLILFTAFSAGCFIPLFLMRDFGTASVFFMGMLIIAFMRSGDLRAILLFIGVAVVGIIAIITLKPYVASRFATFMHAWDNPYDGGYQQVSTMIAIGSGGLFGVGGGKGNLDLVAASDTDLVFGFVAEEWGLIVGLACVAALIIFALYAVKRAALTYSVYYSIAAAAAAGMFLFQAALNIFGSTDLLPLTGVTLPLISNGGSSMLASMGMLAFIKSAGLGGDAK